jgi:hypothetical protein
MVGRKPFLSRLTVASSTLAGEYPPERGLMMRVQRRGMEESFLVERDSVTSVTVKATIDFRKQKIAVLPMLKERGLP